MFSVVLAVAMASLDTSLTNTALPTIASDLNTTAADSIWVVSAYQLAMVATLLPMAALGEIIEHRRVSLAGLVLFTLASIACGFADSLGTLVAARALQGLGGSAMMAVNLALVSRIYPPEQLGRGAGFNAFVVGLCFAIGPTLSSVVLAFATWPWLFLAKIPFCLLALVAGWRGLPATRRSAHRFDSVASLLSAGVFGCFVLLLGEFTHQAPLQRLLIEASIVMVCLIALLLRQAGHPAPILATDLYRRPVFALSSLVAMCSFTAQGAAFVALPFLFQHELGRTEVATGLLITPWPAVVALLAPVAGPWSDRLPAAWLCGIGLGLLALGLGLLARLPIGAGDLAIVWPMMIAGLGFGLFQAPNLRSLLASAPAHRSGGASGVIATSRLIGQSTGAALVAACFVWAPDRASALALWAGAGFAAVGAVASFARLHVRHEPA